MKKKKKKLLSGYKLKSVGKFLLVILFIYLLNLLHLRLDKSEISPAANTVKYKVRYLYNYDGDTAVFRDEEGNEIVCRFLAVDSPEIGEPGYDEAKSFTDSILRNAFSITLELDPRSEDVDKFGRLLAWVWADNKLVQAKLVEKELVNIDYPFGNYMYTDYLYRIAGQKNVTGGQ